MKTKPTEVNGSHVTHADDGRRTASNGILLAGNFTTYRPTSRTRPTCEEKTICPTRSNPLVLKMPEVEGGTPISKNIATELTYTVFGVMSSVTRSSWMTSGFVFRDPESSLSFGLVARKSETKGFVMSVQAYVLKNLMFSLKAESSRLGLIQLKTQQSALMLRADQDDVLVRALSDVLWKIAKNDSVDGVHEKLSVFVCLPQSSVYLIDDAEFATDGLTERIQIFEFVRLDELQNFLRLYLYILQEPSGPGCLLLLYSIVLTKGFAKLKSELDDVLEHLLQPRGECSQALINLLLTGSASPFTHNGSIYGSGEDELSEGKMMVGILDRSEIGLLTWHQSDPGGDTVGSRLKTPRLPIWLTKAAGQYGVLFNTSLELTRDYHAERQFDLFYYSSNRSQNDVICLSIDTKVVRSKEEREIPSLERLILTKWHDAQICWNGSTPFV